LIAQLYDKSYEEMGAWIDKYFLVSQFSMEQMDQKHKVCVQHWILNASLSTGREEDYLASRGWKSLGKTALLSGAI
jgi:hypothetical protein